MKNNKIVRIICFYVIAVSCSFVFRINPPAWYENIHFPFGLTIFKNLLRGLGPVLGAIIVFAVFKLKHETSTFGTSTRLSILMTVLPVALLSIVGIENDESLNIHYFGMIVGLFSVGYAYFEEYGWRGYLNEELKNVPTILKSFIIGTLWFFWHLNTLQEDSLQSNFIFWSILVVTSWGIGKITDMTKSILVACCFHMVGSIMSFNKQVVLSDPQRFLVTGICLTFWIIIVIRWKKWKA